MRLAVAESGFRKLRPYTRLETMSPPPPDPVRQYAMDVLTTTAGGSSSSISGRGASISDVPMPGYGSHPSVWLMPPGISSYS